MHKSLKISFYIVCLFFYCHTFCTQGYRHLQTLSNQIMISRALYVAADLQLADHLDVPLSLQELAQKTGSHFAGLKRLLRCLMEHNIFAYDENGFICNNETSVFLKKNHAHTIRPFILHDDPTRWNALGNLGHSIKTGDASFNQLYDTDYFSYLQHDAVLSNRFDEAMTIISQQEDILISEKLNFSGIVADIGGGKGQLLQCIQENHKNVTQLLLFDLEQVQQNISLRHSSIRQISGSFFDTMDICADIFLLKRILHDWDDNKAERILHNIALAMDDASVLYIVDAVVDQCENKKLILDIDLRLLTIFGGQERTQSEFETLCTAAGLEIVAIHHLTEISHIIECHKKKRA